MVSDGIPNEPVLSIHLQQRTGPGVHLDTASRNAGFIRQRPLRHLALPDKSGVPAGGPFAVGGSVKMHPPPRSRIDAVTKAHDSDRAHGSAEPQNRHDRSRALTYK